MIALLEGRIAERRDDRVIVVANGVGYEVLVTSGTLAALPASSAADVRLFTRMQVRDDSMVLYGFASLDEREVFDLLVTVSGVGPKFALAALSALDPGAIRLSVATGDVDVLTTVPGIGKKVAGRIVVDLKDKLGGDAATPVASGPMAEVREALLALGLSPDEARDAMDGLVTGNGHGERPVEELLREALQTVGRA